MKESEVVQCSWLEDPQHSIEETSESQGGRGGIEGQPGARDGGEDRGRRYKMGRRGIRGLETRVGQECSIIRGGARLYSRGIHVGGVRGGSHSVTVGGAAPRVRAAKSSEFGEGKL